MSDNKEKDNNKAARVVLTIIAFIMIIVGSVWFGVYLYQQHSVPEDTTSTTVAEVTEKEQQFVKNPINFSDLKKQNEEIFAWIKVPGTKVDYPVCQSSVADDFYLKHDAYTKQWSASGAVYIQSLNTPSFNDRVTVIYGHNGYGDTFFTTLHNFEKQDFFNEHEEFYIYTPNSKLTYKIVSAFKYDDRHLLNSFDIQNDDIFTEFLGIVKDPDSSNKNVRESFDRELTTDDKIVVLSTCITNQKSNRYLVCGVQIKNEATN